MNMDEAQKEAAEIIKEGVKEGIKGALVWLGSWWFVSIMLVAASGVAINHYSSRDSSDTAEERSGLNVRTDALTGCQYLETAHGAITPRMDRTGAQICTGGAQ